MFITKTIEDSGSMKMNNFKKIHNCAITFKGNFKSETKVDERKQQEEKIEDRA